MGEVPPSDEWKHVDRGKEEKRPRHSILNRKTLLMALRVLSLAVSVARFLKDLFGGA